jgi:hypothetical protein
MIEGLDAAQKEAFHDLEVLSLRLTLACIGVIDEQSRQ